MDSRQNPAGFVPGLRELWFPFVFFGGGGVFGLMVLVRGVTRAEPFGVVLGVVAFAGGIYMVERMIRGRRRMVRRQRGATPER